MLQHHEGRQGSEYGRWFRDSHDEYFIAYQPEDREVPLPNTAEGLMWWEDQAQEDLDKAVNLCVRLYNAGCKWATKLAERLIDQFA